ncbi:MAG: LON peptidase substrate-binding domain-containing protein [Solirubrobacteraceae bacterium]
MERQSQFPLFPLSLVALPGEEIRLHIFEQRYRAMVSECLEHEREFGIIWLADDELKDVGCACEIARVLERMDDGRMNILARATRPFRLLEREDGLAYPAGTIDLILDDDETADADAADAARESYAALVSAATDDEPDQTTLATMSAYAMAATVDFGLEAKQRLLELRSENARMRLLARLLRAALRRLDFVDRAQARARSNGKVRFS